MTDKRNTIYAPVIIPTLNRVEHLKRCIESLERCTDSDKTDVYVAVDYPPSSKYIDGWKQVNTYLDKKSNNHVFRQLKVIKRHHNYGVCNENSNYNALIKELRNYYDFYILTEDDNEFSPCFLQYMNKAFLKFYDDDRIFLICGYNYKMTFPESDRNNFYITKNGCPWGTGEWYHKSDALEKISNLEKIARLIKDDSTYNVLKSRNPQCVYNAIKQIKRHTLLPDAIKGIYSTLYDKYCLMPRVSMVRNWGNDGTGDHCKKMDEEFNSFFIKQEISADKEFVFTDDIFTMEPDCIERITVKQKLNLRSVYKLMVQRIDLFLFRQFNYIPQTKYL